MLYSGNWGDEIDVDGFVIIKSEFVSYIKKFLKSYNSTISVDVGFKEASEYENGNELLQEISFNRITNKEADTIEKHFGISNDFGLNLLLSIKQSSEMNSNDNVFDFKTEEL